MMLAIVAESALRSLLLGGAVWIGLHVLRVRNPHVQMTAFFQRSEESMFDPHGDGWYLQQFNQRHLQDSASLDIDRKSTRLNSSHRSLSRMPSSA